MGDIKDKLNENAEKLESAVEDAHKNVSEKAGKLKEDAKAVYSESEQELNKMVDTIETAGKKGLEALKNVIDDKK